MRKTWTRNDIIEAISDNVGLSLSESSEIIEEIFEFILDELEKGEDVKISSFGTFSVRHRAAREGINPQNPSQKIQIPAANVPGFKAGKALKAAVN